MKLKKLTVWGTCVFIALLVLRHHQSFSKNTIKFNDDIDISTQKSEELTSSEKEALNKYLNEYINEKNSLKYDVANYILDYAAFILAGLMGIGIFFTIRYGRLKREVTDTLTKQREQHSRQLKQIHDQQRVIERNKRMIGNANLIRDNFYSAILKILYEQKEFDERLYNKLNYKLVIMSLYHMDDSERAKAILYLQRHGKKDCLDDLQAIIDDTLESDQIKESAKNARRAVLSRLHSRPILWSDLKNQSQS